jgi:hypothetical protein
VSQTPRFCGKCGAQLTPGIRFCGSCGAPTTTGATPGVYPPAPGFVPRQPKPSHPRRRKGLGLPIVMLGGLVVGLSILVIIIFASMTTPGRTGTGTIPQTLVAIAVTPSPAATLAGQVVPSPSPSSSTSPSALAVSVSPTPAVTLVPTAIAKPTLAPTVAPTPIPDPTGGAVLAIERCLEALVKGDTQAYQSSFTPEGQKGLAGQMQQVLQDQKALKISPNPSAAKITGSTAVVPALVEITMLTNKKETVPSEFKLMRSGGQWLIDSLTAVAPFSMPGAPPWAVIPQGCIVEPSVNTVRTALNAIKKKDRAAFDAVFAPEARQAGESIWGSALNARSFTYELPDDLWQEKTARDQYEAVVRLDLLFTSQDGSQIRIPTDFRLKMVAFHEYVIIAADRVTR